MSSSYAIQGSEPPLTLELENQPPRINLAGLKLAVVDFERRPMG